MISAALALAFAPPQTVYTVVEGAAVGVMVAPGIADPPLRTCSPSSSSSATQRLQSGARRRVGPGEPRLRKHWSRAAVTAPCGRRTRRSTPSSHGSPPRVGRALADGRGLARVHARPRGLVLRAPAYERHCTATGRPGAVRTAGPYSLPATIALSSILSEGPSDCRRCARPRRDAGRRALVGPAALVAAPRRLIRCGGAPRLSNASGAPPTRTTSLQTWRSPASSTNGSTPSPSTCTSSGAGSGYGPETLHQDPRNEGSEAALDVEMVTPSRSRRRTSRTSSTATITRPEPFLTWICNLSASDDVALIQSVSYYDKESRSRRRTCGASTSSSRSSASAA